MDFVGVVIAVGAMNILSFLLGMKASVITNGKKMDLNPITAVRERKQQKASKEKAKRDKAAFDIMMENIDAYDGTSQNQKDIPRRHER